jgi:DNA gyrase/topoisomerase IV subunit B
MTNEPSRGLDWVRKRPGMYTDTTRPNQLAQEVIDCSYVLSVKMLEPQFTDQTKERLSSSEITNFGETPGQR